MLKPLEKPTIGMAALIGSSCERRPRLWNGHSEPSGGFAVSVHRLAMGGPQRGGNVRITKFLFWRNTMKSLKVVMLLTVVAVLASASSADAGLFGCKKKKCCKPVCCEPAPEPCCEPAPEPCCAPEPVCCEPAPVCEPAPAPCCEPAPVCAPEPVCCEPAPVCCEPAPCCEPCKKPGLFARLIAKCKAKRAARCCDPCCP